MKRHMVVFLVLLLVSCASAPRKESPEIAQNASSVVPEARVQDDQTQEASTRGQESVGSSDQEQGSQGKSVEAGKVLEVLAGLASLWQIVMAIMWGIAGHAFWP